MREREREKGRKEGRKEEREIESEIKLEMRGRVEREYRAAREIKRMSVGLLWEEREEK